MLDPQERAIMPQMARGYLHLADVVGRRHERGTARREQGEVRSRNDS